MSEKIMINKIGLEIECGTEYYHEVELLLGECYSFGHLEEFNIGHDGSVNVERCPHDDLEIRLKMKYEKFLQLREFFIVLFDHIKQNRTCGNHVHLTFIDESGSYERTSIAALTLLSHNVWDMFYSRYEAKFGNIRKFMDRLSNHYSNFRKYTNEEIMRATYGILDGAIMELPRYRTINIQAYENHGTVEVRVLPYMKTGARYYECVLWIAETILDILNTERLEIASDDIIIPEFKQISIIKV